jgi:hypothetical protein
MIGTKSLYASTLALAGLAGFSTGWIVRPVEVRAVVSFEERLMMDYEALYRLGPAERESLRTVLRDFALEMDALRNEVDRKFGDQVNAVKDRADARIRAICTPERRR